VEQLADTNPAERIALSPSVLVREGILAFMTRSVARPVDAPRLTRLG
jgi:hypothetical protein